MQHQGVKVFSRDTEADNEKQGQRQSRSLELQIKSSWFTWLGIRAERMSVNMTNIPLPFMPPTSAQSAQPLSLSCQRTHCIHLKGGHIQSWCVASGKNVWGQCDRDQLYETLVWEGQCIVKKHNKNKIRNRWHTGGAHPFYATEPPPVGCTVTLEPQLKLENSFKGRKATYLKKKKIHKRKEQTQLEKMQFVPKLNICYLIIL